METVEMSFVFVGEDEEEKEIKMNLSKFFWLIGGEQLLIVHEKSSDIEKV
jgi:hypothetical protein